MLAKIQTKSNRRQTCIVFGSLALCVARTVVDLPLLGRDLVSTPAVDAVRQPKDVFVVFDAEKLAVTGTLEVVVTVVLQWCTCLEAADCGHGIGRQRGCWRRDSRRRCHSAPEVLGLSRGRHHHGGRCEKACEAERDHFVGGCTGVGDVSKGLPYVAVYKSLVQSAKYVRQQERGRACRRGSRGWQMARPSRWLHVAGWSGWVREWTSRRLGAGLAGLLAAVV